MKRRLSSPFSRSSMNCSSSFVPSVVVTSACVSPRVNNAEPCVRGSQPTSQVIGRIAENLFLQMIETLLRHHPLLDLILRIRLNDFFLQGINRRITRAFFLACRV